ncbi:MAG: serine--tRNA ligase [bacterium]|nr:serine--tRNA ligase [bacterium]
MLDIELIRKNPDLVKAGVAKKKVPASAVDLLLEKDTKWREAVKKIEDLRAKLNQFSKERNIEEAKKVKEEMKAFEQVVPELEKERNLAWIKLPNLPADDVPVGPDESGNKPIRQWPAQAGEGAPTKFDFEPKDHLALGEALGIIDTETAGKVSGSRFAYLKGDAALLQMALVKFVFDTLGNEKILKKIADKVEKGYSAKPFVPVIPPVMIKPEVFKRMARLDPGQEEERYHLQTDDLYLVGSAEHTLGPIHMDSTIPEDQFPLRYIGYSTSFRREAGSHGKDVKGILRMHQFDKLEMESFTAPENSRKEQDFIVGIQEYLMQQLEIPYQVVSVCTGDMGGPDYRQLDIEAWLPGQNKYRETHTSDLMTDYQSRRLATKIKRKDGKTELVHMNDATAFAIGRIIIAILENYQTKEGTVMIPKVLRKLVGKKEIK